MTDYSHFEKLVADHKSLNSLINNHKYGGINSVKPAEWMTPEFIDWLSPKYYLAFVTIYEQNREKNIGSICAVVRENALANDLTKVKMAEFIMPSLDQSIECLEIFLRQITESKYNSLEYLKEFAIGTNILTVTTFKSLEVDILSEKKKQYSELLLSIADRFKNVSKMRDEINFSFYEKVNTALKTLNLKGNLEERVLNHEKKMNRKGVWYAAGIIFAVILLCLRFLVRMG